MDKERIVEIREALGKNREEFAALLGTSIITIGRWERGDFKPSPIYLKSLVKIEAYAVKKKLVKKNG